MRGGNVAGLLERRHVYYWARIAVNIGLVAAAGGALYLAHGTWWVLLVAVFFAIVSTQLAFTGHEAGHRQMFRSRSAGPEQRLALGELLCLTGREELGAYWLRSILAADPTYEPARKALAALRSSGR